MNVKNENQYFILFDIFSLHPAAYPGTGFSLLHQLMRYGHLTWWGLD